MKRFTLLIALCALMASIVIGCTNNPTSPLVGYWVEDTASIEMCDSQLLIVEHVCITDDNTIIKWETYPNNPELEVFAADTCRMKICDDERIHVDGYYIEGGNANISYRITHDTLMLSDNENAYRIFIKQQDPPILPSGRKLTKDLFKQLLFEIEEANEDII